MFKIEPSARTSDSESLTVQPVYAVDGSTLNIIPREVENVKEKLIQSEAEVTDISKKQPSLISDQTLDELLSDQSFLSFLTRKGGLKLSQEMSQEQKRVAVKEAVERIAKRKTNTETGKEAFNYP